VSITGRKLKPEGQAVTRHKPTHDWIEIENVRFAGGPDLPATRRRGEAWPQYAYEIWDIWSTMPHCILWDEKDWEFAAETVEVAVRFYEGSLQAATELRNRQKLLGTTWSMLRDLRIRYVEPGAEKVGGKVTRIADYRAL
jgi:hypothetical protein